MNRWNHFILSTLMASCLLLLATHSTAQAQFFFTGGVDNDFFNELNWTANADGTGANPAGDPLIDSTTNAIALDLIIDGDSVVADGQVDFGPGSLTLQSGSLLSITGAGNDLDINADSTFSLTDARVEVNDIINFEGTSSFSGGSVESITDDIAFQDNFVNLSIDGTTFISLDNTYFDGFVGSIQNTTINSSDRLGLRNNVAVVMTNADITVNGGSGDIDDVFGSSGAGSSLELLGASTLLADSVEEGADLILGGSTFATMGGQGVRIVADGSTITMNTTAATLVVGPLNAADVDFVDARPFLINGLTGDSYATDSSTWNVQGWDGVSPITLRVVPEPTSLAMLVGALGLAAVKRRRGRVAC